MSRRRKPTAQERYISERLDYIFQAYLGSPEKRDRPGARAAWWKLYEETVAGEKLGTIDVFYAGWILHWGWFLGMQERRFREAAEFLSAYFQHPEVEEADVWTRIEHQCHLATSIMFSGNEAAAVEMLRPLLQDARKSHVQRALMGMQAGLTDYLCEPPADARALPALADLVEEVVNRLKRRVPKKKRLPENATYGDLQNLLDSTYPPSGLKVLQAERESRHAGEYVDL
jgi:hypothetical protein